MNQLLPRAAAIRVFLLFALVYLLSMLVRAVTATLAPELSASFALDSGALGLLAGSYFIGFCLMQIPLGICLDRFGPPRTAVAFLCVALLGGAMTAAAQTFPQMLLGRTLLGLGLAAGLMAPLTAYRRWYSPAAQVRANAWMQMVGALGMLLSTLPVQWLLPQLGWRGVFWAWCGVGALALLGLLLGLPRWSASGSVLAPPGVGAPASVLDILKGYGVVLRNRRFISVAPLAFFGYGGLFAILTLWAGPWLRDVSGQTAEQAAAGLLGINTAMMLAFFAWGLVAAPLERRGLQLESLTLGTMLLGLLVLPWVVWQGADSRWPHWAVYCLSLTGFSLVQPKLAQQFPSQLAGRALTAFNLVIFTGTFFVQWGLGLAIDLLQTLGWSQPAAYQGAMLLLWLCKLLALGWFLRRHLPPARPNAGPNDRAQRV